MAHYKLNDIDERFLQLAGDTVVLFAGSGGTETWIERRCDTVVSIGVKSVGVAVADGATLETRIEIGGDVAKGHDGPAPLETQLRAGQMVQVLVKAGERLAFRAYPEAHDAHVLRTVVWTADMRGGGREETERAAPAPQPDEQDTADQSQASQARH